MSAAPDLYARADETPTVDGNSIQHFPQFGLEWLYDNRMRPEEVTILDRATSDISTHWITIDVEHAVPVEEIR